MIKPPSTEIYSAKEIAAMHGVTPKIVARWCQFGQVLHCEFVCRGWLLRLPFRVFATPADKELYIAMTDAPVLMSTSDIHALRPEWSPTELFKAADGLQRRGHLRTVRHEGRTLQVLTDRLDELPPEAELLPLPVLPPRKERAVKPRKKKKKAKAVAKPKVAEKVVEKPKVVPPPPPPRLTFAQMALKAAGLPY